MPEDSELLRLYAEHHSQDAFTTLVQRHLALVYSAALRQFDGDSHRAQETVQTVFTLLARKAGSLQGHPTLNGWLYTTTYHTAAKLRRAEFRRLRREREAHAMQADQQNPSAHVAWEQLRPVIDELMVGLREPDRIAVLLRFFEGRSHGEIGVRLGLSENAARMRLDRALDTLQLALARRGIVSTATALGAALSSHAMLIPPAGLAAAVSTGATAAGVGAGLLFLIMNSTPLKIALLTAVLGAGTAGLIWQNHEIKQLHQQVSRLQADADARPPERPAAAATLSVPDRDLAAELARLRRELAELKNSPANSWQDRVARLRQLLQRVPELAIPELQLTTEEDWLDAAKPELETEEDYRRALAKIRSMGMMRFANMARTALAQYLKNNGGQFPTDVAQLEQYMEQPVDRTVWSRYVVQPASTMRNMKMGGDWIITQRGAVDVEYDSVFAIGPYGSGMTTYSSINRQAVLAPVLKAYIAANPGKQPAHPAELLSYATTPEQKAVVEKTIDGMTKK